MEVVLRQFFVGDVVKIAGDRVSVMKDETEKRRKEIDDLMNDVFE